MHYADAGGIARGAFSDGRLVGIGVVVLHMRPAIAQLAFLHVSQEFRAAGVGSRLAADLELVARRAGDREIVVSATPSETPCASTGVAATGPWRGRYRSSSSWSPRTSTWER